MIYQLFDREHYGSWDFLDSSFKFLRPDISGEWEGIIKSSVNGKDSKMVATIKQTWSRWELVALSITLIPVASPQYFSRKNHSQSLSITMKMSLIRGSQKQ
ncbi:MAG: hypothetical protein IPK04_15615 [Bdellovibrionales bacterium]|nr:hypothetical protein [Bdellovibrionales bacterium]